MEDMNANLCSAMLMLRTFVDTMLWNTPLLSTAKHITSSLPDLQSPICLESFSLITS